MFVPFPDLVQDLVLSGDEAHEPLQLPLSVTPRVKNVIWFNPLINLVGNYDDSSLLRG